MRVDASQTFRRNSIAKFGKTSNSPRGAEARLGTGRAAIRAAKVANGSVVLAAMAELEGWVAVPASEPWLCNSLLFMGSSLYADSLFSCGRVLFEDIFVASMMDNRRIEMLVSNWGYCVPNCCRSVFGLWSAREKF